MLSFLRSFLNPDPKPFHEGYLPAVDGHQVFFRQFGNPNGPAILLFHGGPGSCSKPRHAKSFDLKKYHVIMFDQRGCGLSQPMSAIEHNTFSDLIADARRLLAMLEIEKVILYGGSWGSTLALVFAETYPELVEKMVISQTFLARAKDVDWIACDSARFYPDIMEKVAAIVPDGETLRGFYARITFSDRAEDQIKATKLYGNYERLLGELDPVLSDDDPTPDHIASFRVYMHYDRNDYGLSENQILNNIEKIRHIPTLIIHNRHDFVCLVEQAYELHKHLPKSELIIVPDSGHGSDKQKKIMRERLQLFLEDR